MTQRRKTEIIIIIIFVITAFLVFLAKMKMQFHR